MTEPSASRVRRPARRLALMATALVVSGVVTFGILAPPEHCPRSTAAGLVSAADDAVQWFVRNQRPDGTWLYQYDASRDVVVDDYNGVRHAGAIMGLYQAAAIEIPGALESADRGRLVPVSYTHLTLPTICSV